jgi:hypothetical protein
MKVKLLEHYQDAQVHYLPEQEVDVDATLGAWLVEHRKAVKAVVDEPPTQPPAPQPKRSKRGKS